MQPVDDDKLNDEIDKRWVWPHPGDLGTILIAGVFLAGMVGAVLFIFSSPEPVRDLLGKKHPAANSGEVTVTLAPK